MLAGINLKAANHTNATKYHLDYHRLLPLAEGRALDAGAELVVPPANRREPRESCHELLGTLTNALRVAARVHWGRTMSP
jgi:hypothetical protein